MPDAKIKMQSILIHGLAVHRLPAGSSSALDTSIRNSGFSVPRTLPLANEGLL